MAPAARIAKEHPEWVNSPEGNGRGLLNLGPADARKYITDNLSGAIRAYRLGCLRIEIRSAQCPGSVLVEYRRRGGDSPKP